MIPIALPATGDEEWQAVRAPLADGWLTQGPRVAAFERAFAARHRVPHALAASSCTTALHLILAALEIGPGDEVILPAYTWVSTANVVLYCGATPVFADVDRATCNLDPATHHAPHPRGHRRPSLRPVRRHGCAGRRGARDSADRGRSLRGGRLLS
jgi:perosamine synthetase